MAVLLSAKMILVSLFPKPVMLKHSNRVVADSVLRLSVM